MSYDDLRYSSHMCLRMYVKRWGKGKEKKLGEKKNNFIKVKVKGNEKPGPNK